jgi:hypothetical protein
MGGSSTRSGVDFWPNGAVVYERPLDACIAVCGEGSIGGGLRYTKGVMLEVPVLMVWGSSRR